MKSLIYYWMTF